MSEPAILLVEDDPKHARLVAQALERHVLPRPAHVPSGEQAVLWIGDHDCALCLLDVSLPGIDGLETLVRLRQRRPDLPVIMLSDTRAEATAITAFRAGVTDYVPKTGHYADTVARLARQALGDLTPPPEEASAATATGLLEALTWPTYQNRLRVIGRQLDLYAYQSVNLLEVSGGFLVRALRPGKRVPEALEFSDRDFPQMVAGAIAARGEGERQRAGNPLLPTGYEDFLPPSAIAWTPSRPRPSPSPS